MGILSDVKKLLNVPDDYPYFDSEILMHANSVLLSAYQLGFTKASGLVIDESTEWSAVFLDEISTTVRQWFAFKIRLNWDPPQGSSLESIKSAIDEMEWRLIAQLELPTLIEGGVQT